MRADGADLAAELKALADDISELVQNLREIAAGALLQQHRRDEEMNVERRHALCQLLQGYVKRQSKIVFLEGAPEFSGERLLEFAVNHLQRNRESVTGAHGAGHEFQTFRELLFELPHPFGPFVPHGGDGNEAARGHGQPGKHPQVRRQKEPRDRSRAHGRQQAGLEKTSHRHLRSGLLEHHAQALLKVETGSQTHQQRRKRLIGVDERGTVPGPFFLFFRGAEQAGLQAIHVRAAECRRGEPPDAQHQGPYCGDDDQEDHWTSRTSSNRSGRRRIPAASSLS